MSQPFHAPVLIEETLEIIGDATRILDCTLGDGGHTSAFLRCGASVVAIDRDPDAIRRASERLSEDVAAKTLLPLNANFADLDAVPELDGQTFDAVLLDLGVSSRQLDEGDRGFTFRPGAPLDMRMGPNVLQDAATLLNTAAESTLEQILRQYADEPRARRLAAEIVRRRERRPFMVSDDLVGAIRAVLGPRSGPSEFARIFQGFRIAVNDEIAALEHALPDLRDRLIPSGVIVVISYHSGEDRLVKNVFRDWTKGCICPPKHPMCTCGRLPLGETITRRALKAGELELQKNPRSRSARLRAWRKSE